MEQQHLIEASPSAALGEDTQEKQFLANIRHGNLYINGLTKNTAQVDVWQQQHVYKSAGVWLQ